MSIYGTQAPVAELPDHALVQLPRRLRPPVWKIIDWEGRRFKLGLVSPFDIGRSDEMYHFSFIMEVLARGLDRCPDNLADEIPKFCQELPPGEKIYVATGTLHDPVKHEEAVKVIENDGNGPRMVYVGVRPLKTSHSASTKFVFVIPDYEF
jgi:hypothetical protein